MTSVPDENSTTRVQAAPMLPCLQCGEPIQYAINRGISVELIPDQSPAITYRGMVGDLCERCALHSASDDVRPAMQRDLHVLQEVRRRFNFPTSCTFQNFYAFPRPERGDLHGFSLERVGFWAAPAKGVQYFRDLTNSVRHEHIPAELLWIQDIYEHVEIIDNDKRASITQMKHLMNGLRFLREEHNRRAGIGGPVGKNITYEEAIAARRSLFEKYEESFRLTGTKERRPTNPDLADHLGISPSKLYTLIKEWRRNGHVWQSRHGEDGEEWVFGVLRARPIVT